jgi:hypothetical protein
MILMLVKEDTPWARGLEGHLAPYGVSVVHYRHPLKALDNLVETRPSIVLYDLQDFPRHWKILVKYLREEYQKDEVIFLLVSNGPPPLEEANKALYLGVNGILQFHGDVEALARNIREVFLRYGTFEVDTAGPPPVAGSEAPLAFLFRHPRGKHLVTGVLVKYDGRRATFKPDFAHEVADLSEGETLAGGSLRLAESLVNVDATIVKNNGQLHLAVRTQEG